MNLDNHMFTLVAGRAGKFNVVKLDPIQGEIKLGTVHKPRMVGDDQTWGAWPEMDATAFVDGFHTRDEAVAWLSGARFARLGLGRR